MSGLRRSGWCIGLILLVGQSVLLSCSKSGGDIIGNDETQDLTSPAAIHDLDVIAVTPTGVRLRWSVTGDDGDSGRAVGYDLRYLRCEIDPTNWDSAAAVPGMPVPGAPGAFDSVDVAGLTEDSTYFFAIRAVDEAENWSPMSNIVRATCFDDFAVALPDSVLDGLIRFYLGKPTGPILRSDLASFDRLDATNQHIRDLSGIEYCVNLEALFLWNNNVGDLAPLSGLTRLRHLRLGYNGISDISALAPLVGLDTLWLNANRISDVSALAGMTNLEELQLTSNLVWNLAPLAGKTTIRSLYLVENQVVFVSPLYNLAGLEKLDLKYNQVDDILGLAANSGLGAGDTVWLSGNPLAAPSTDSLLSAMRDRGVVVIY